MPVTAQEAGERQLGDQTNLHSIAGPATLKLLEIAGIMGETKRAGRIWTAEQQSLQESSSRSLGAGYNSSHPTPPPAIG